MWRPYRSSRCLSGRGQTSRSTNSSAYPVACSPSHLQRSGQPSGHPRRWPSPAGAQTQWTQASWGEGREPLAPQNVRHRHRCPRTAVTGKAKPRLRVRGSADRPTWHRNIPWGRVRAFNAPSAAVFRTAAASKPRPGGNITGFINLEVPERKVAGTPERANPAGAFLSVTNSTFTGTVLYRGLLSRSGQGDIAAHHADVKGIQTSCRRMSETRQ